MSEPKDLTRSISQLAFRFRLALVALSVAILAIITIATSGYQFTPRLLYDGPSYVNMAGYILKNHSLPQLELRPPLYPLLLAFFLRQSPDNGLHYVVYFQQFLWVASAVLIFFIVYRLGGKIIPAALAGLLYCTLSETFFFIRAIYAESLAIFLSLAASLALLMAAGRPGFWPRLWTLVSAIFVLATVYTRPIFQLLLPIFSILIVLDFWHDRREMIIKLLLFVLVTLVGLLPWYLVHTYTRGAPFFVKGAGYSLTNYLGDRRLLGHFPKKYSELEKIYAKRFAEKPKKKLLAWWDVQEDWLRAYKKRTGRPLSPDLLDYDMGHTVATILLQNPGYYVTRWFETWREFSTSTTGPPKGRLSPLALASLSWNAFWQNLGLWIPFVILLFDIRFWKKSGASAMILLPSVVYISIALGNTAIEPWPGQLRYRLQIDAFLLMAIIANPIKYIYQG